MEGEGGLEEGNGCDDVDAIVVMPRAVDGGDKEAGSWGGEGEGGRDDDREDIVVSVIDDDEDDDEEEEGGSGREVRARFPSWAWG